MSNFISSLNNVNVLLLFSLLYMAVKQNTSEIVFVVDFADELVVFVGSIIVVVVVAVAEALAVSNYTINVVALVFETVF